MSDRLNALFYNPYFLCEDAESRFGHMVVPWSLRGATIHNVVVAMAVAPSMHRELSLLARCEVAMTGFVCLDLFRMVADQKASLRGVPRGSMFMAPQTMANLQGVALSVIAICISKPPSWSPWRRGTARVSEITVEQFFHEQSAFCTCLLAGKCTTEPSHIF